MKKQTLVEKIFRILGLIKPKRYNKKTYNAYHKKWRDSHKEHLKEYQRKRYQMRKCLK
jgi:hypothetical protein